MEERQQRRLDVIGRCLDGLETCVVCSRCTALITEAQRQLDKLLSAGAPAEVVRPISQDEAARAHTKGTISFPPELLLWVNNEIVKNYDSTNGSSHIEVGRAPAYEGDGLLSCKVLSTLFSTAGWNVQQIEPGIIVFLKRDEKQDPSIN
jgi:hypothetical protein